MPAPANPEPTQDAPPKTLSADEISEMVTGAVRSHTKREVQTALKTAFEELKLEEMIAGAVQKIHPPKPVEDDKQKPDASKPDPRLIALEEKAAQLEKQYKAEFEAREKAEKRSRDDAARSALRTSLAPAFEGHPNAAAVVDTVAQLLFDAQKRVNHDESGNPTFTFRKSPGHGLEPEDMQFSISDGVSQWLKSDEAKIFLPPPNPQKGALQSTPNRQVTRNANGVPTYERPAENDDERVRRASERAALLSQRMPGFSFDD